MYKSVYIVIHQAWDWERGTALYRWCLLKSSIDIRVRWGFSRLVIDQLISSSIWEKIQSLRTKLKS